MKEFSSENTLILRNQLADDIVRDKEAVFRNAKGRFLLAGRNKQALGKGFLQGTGGTPAPALQPKKRINSKAS